MNIEPTPPSPISWTGPRTEKTFTDSTEFGKFKERSDINILKWSLKFSGNNKIYEYLIVYEEHIKYRPIEDPTIYTKTFDSEEECFEFWVDRRGKEMISITFEGPPENFTGIVEYKVTSTEFFNPKPSIFKSKPNNG